MKLVIRILGGLSVSGLVFGGAVFGAWLAVMPTGIVYAQTASSIAVEGNRRVEADTILGAVEKARGNDAFFELSGQERAAIDKAVNELLLVYHSDSHHLILEKIEQLNQSTTKLAENMMNTAVRGALKGTKI